MNKQLVKDFAYVNSAWEKTFLGPLSARAWTFRAALNLALQAGSDGPLHILETGCQRMIDDWGGGCSTRVFANFLQNHAPKHSVLVSVDIDPGNLALASQVVEVEVPSDTRQFEFQPILGDSLTVLRDSIQGGPGFDLIYLDSLDCDPRVPEGKENTEAAQRHQLMEAKLAIPSFYEHNKFKVLLLDDSNLPYGGKCKLTKEFLLDTGWTCVLDYQQSLFINT